MTTEERPAPPSRGRAARTRRLPAWVEFPVLVVLTLLVAALVRTFLVQPFFIPSGSMEDTLHVGDRVLVDKVSYRFGNIGRGDVVVFNGLDSFTPEVQVDEGGNALQRGMRHLGAAIGLAPPGEKDFIKRVIGIPGDHVVCCDKQGRIAVNGTALEESSYLFPGDAASDVRFDVTVPAGRLWVMGDHRGASADSRAHIGDPGGGTVPEDKVIGRAFAVVWPFGSAKGLGAPATFERVSSPVAAIAGSGPYALALGAVPPLAMVRRRRSGTGR